MGWTWNPFTKKFDKVGTGGAPGVNYTNPNPMPEKVGGYDPGSTFANQDNQQMWDGLLYPFQAPAFTAFALNAVTTPREVGNNLVAGNRPYSWSTSNPANINPNSIRIRDITNAVTLATGLADDGAETLATPAMIHNTSGGHQFRIDATNIQAGNFSRNYNIVWNYRRFYGESLTTPLVEADIESLRVSELSGSFAGTYNFLGGGYKYICHEATMGTLTVFKDQSTNLDVPFEIPYLVSVTNSFGVTRNYRVYRSTNILGGAINIIAS